MYRLSGRSRIMDHDETLPILREGAVTYVDGKPVKEPPTTFQLFGNVQPMSGRELLLVPEGDRMRENLLFWVPLQDGVLLVNDLILRGSYVYQVQMAEDWGSYTRARIMRVDVGPDVSDQFAPITIPGML